LNVLFVRDAGAHDCRFCANSRHLTQGPRLIVASHTYDARSFDKPRDFVLDSGEVGPLIYIWYEGGWLSPPVVTAMRSSEAEPLILKERKPMAKKAAKGAKKKAAKKR